MELQNLLSSSTFLAGQQPSFDQKRDPLLLKLARSLVVGPVGLNPLVGRQKLTLEFTVS